MPEAPLLSDPCQEWAEREGVPIIEGFGVDLRSIDVGSWARLGGGSRGALVHLLGRGDFINSYVLELAPGGQTDACSRFHRMRP